MAIRFIGNEIGDITAYKGFETSFEFMRAVTNGFIQTGTINPYIVYIAVGDYLFDYETGTMWEVME